MRWTDRVKSMRPLLLGGMALLVACAPETDGSDVAETPNTVEGAEAAPAYVIPERVSPVNVMKAPVAEIDSTNWRVKPPFYAAGQEPFWRLDLVDGWFVFQRLGLPEIEAPVVAPERVEGADVFESDVLRLTLEPATCLEAQANGPSLAVATIVFDGISYEGCAYAGASPAATELSVSTENWVNEIGVFMIEVDQCLFALEERHEGAAAKAVVTAMYPREGGVTAFVLQRQNGEVFECGAASNGDVVFFDAVEPRNLADWMQGNGRFLRADNVRPPKACLDAEPVEVDGQLAGYLLPDGCKP